MRFAELIERFAGMPAEEFRARFPHPFLLEQVDRLADPHERRVFLVRGTKGMPLAVGRGPRCHIPMKDPLVSTRHAELLPPGAEGGPWQLVDRGSTNGTFVNGIELPPETPHELSDGDVLGFGPEARFELLGPDGLRALLMREGQRKPTRDLDEPTDVLGTIQHHSRLGTERAARPGDGPERIAGELLVFCEPLDPIPIELNKKLVLGRKPESADVVLAHVNVSRRHAELQRLAEGVFVRDLGSANGTLLEGARVSGDWTPLPMGFRLKVGPFELFVDRPQTSTTGAALLKLSTTLAIEGRGAEGVRGTLTELALSNLLQGLEQEKQTGVLEVSGEGIQGHVTFVDGQPAEARTSEGESGEVAIRRLLRLKQGEYTLRPRREVSSRRIARSFSEIVRDGFMKEA